MAARIGDTNGFKALASLRKVAADPRIEEIEGGALDDGRVFLHARQGFKFDGETVSKSVGSAAEIRYAMLTLEIVEE